MGFLDPKPQTVAGLDAAVTAKATTDGTALKAALSATYGPTATPMTTVFGPTAAGIVSAIATEGAKSFAPLGDASALIKQRRQDVLVVSAFQSGHGWTNNGSVAAGTNLNDTSDAAFGSQAAKIVTIGANQTATLTSPAITAVPLDTITRAWVKYDGPDKLHRVRLWLSDSSAFTSYYQIEVFFSASGVPETSYAWKSGEWVPVAFPWAQATTVGTPNRNALTYLRFLINDRSAGETTIRFGRVEHYTPGSVFPDGVVCLSYDDSYASAYTVARAHLSKYGYTADLFPIIERIDTGSYITSAQIDELAKIHGWAIGSHATTYANHVLGMNGMTSAQRKTELGALRAWGQQRGYGSPTYAYPNGAFTKDATADVGRYFSTGRSAYRTSREVQHLNMPTRIQSLNAGFQTLASLQADIDAAKVNKGVLCILFHDLVTTKVDANDFTIADHAALIDYLAAQGVAVKSLEEVVRAYA